MRSFQEPEENWEKLDTAINNMLVGLGLSARYGQYRALQLWDKIVGEKMASRVQPVKAQNGVLWLRSSTPHWAMEVSLRKQEILDALNKEAQATDEKAFLTDIRFVGAWYSDTR